MRYAIRSLLRQPLFTISAVATLALGIGVNSTIFTFANAAFFRGMPGITSPERLALAGAAIGGILSMPMAYALGALLFGVQIADVAAFALTCGGLVGVAVLASWLPARRAARLDPLFALRTE